MITLALASGLEIAAGPSRGGERLQTLLDALVITPALGPPALALESPTPPRLAVEPPEPAAAEPRGAAAAWIPRARPVAALDQAGRPAR